MKLSIVIVNYNVRHFLELAIRAALKSSEGIETEIFVVDNKSSDDSCEMVKALFPEVKLIANQENVGFSKANNQAFKEATGDWVLILNPDTILAEDTLQKTFQFLDQHSDAGALGIKMIDGTGAFLPESKRGLPTPEVAFYKMTGLSKLFSKSKRFGQYHQGFLDPNDNHEIDVLAGAFMMVRRDVLMEVGMLDEEYFMYGEDIDLSYKITQAGYKNYYFSDSSIVHFKGESTKKGSLNYVRVFYNAMIIFARKHFSSGKAGLYNLGIKLAIVLSGTITLLKNVFHSTKMLLADAVVSFLGFMLIKQVWATNVKGNPTHFPEEFTLWVIPVYICLWTLSAFFLGAYDRPYRLNKVLRSAIAGTVLIAALYGFLPDHLRFSRVLILLGGAWTSLAMILNRTMANITKHRKLMVEEEWEAKLAIVGKKQSVQDILALVKGANGEFNFLGFIGDEEKETERLSTIGEVEDAVEIYNIDVLIFDSRFITYKEMISIMEALGNKVRYKIYMPESNVIIGSDSKNTTGDLYAVDADFRIDWPTNRRNKRLFDILMATVLLACSPILMWLVKRPFGLHRNVFNLLLGRATLVGYANGDGKLPKLKRGVLSILDGQKKQIQDEVTKLRLNQLYARDYEVLQDLQILIRGWRNLGGAK